MSYLKFKNNPVQFQPTPFSNFSQKKGSKKNILKALIYS